MIYVKNPRTASTYFELNFHNKEGIYNNNPIKIWSVGHSWLYSTQIKGWRDWDFPNQEKNIFRDIPEYRISETNIIVTTIRNPFDLLYSYFNYNWGWCRLHHNLSEDLEYNVNEFEKFVNIYLDSNADFHAPAYKSSLFSQLKTKDGNWILKEDSIILRFENLKTDIDNFSKLVNIPITNHSAEAINTGKSTKPVEWYDAYTNAQIDLLTELWDEDLKYFSYNPPNKK